MFSLKKLNSATKLESENKKMEDRLRVLKEMMSAEKARRESDGGYWQSGKSETLQISKKQPPSSISQHLLQSKDTKKPIKVRILTDKNGTSENKSTLLRCGQCEKASASLNCVECIENYCQVCFTKIHQKGGLAKHHVKPILRNMKCMSPHKPAPTTSIVEPSMGEQNAEAVSLLKGSYDEASNAKSFQEALAEWRKNGTTSKESATGTFTVKDSFSVTTSEVATMAGATQIHTGSLRTEPQKTELNFTDKNKVTYFEKLLMKKYKDGTMTTQSSSVVHPVQTEIQSDEEPEKVPMISEYNVFYDSEDMLPEDEDSRNHTTGITSDSTWMPGLPAVFIEELTSNNEGFKPEHPKGAENTPQVEPGPNSETRDPKMPGPRSHGASEARGIEATGPPKMRAPKSKNGYAKRKKGKEKQTTSEKKQSPASSETARAPQVVSETRDVQTASEANDGRSENGHTKTDEKQMHNELNTPHLTQSDLTVSVESAWANCQSSHNHQHLGHFFLHGVQPQSSEEGDVLSSPNPQALKSADNPFEFKLASTVWLPNSSTVQLEPQLEPQASCDIFESDSIDALASRPTTRQSKDLYDDTESGSEPENEREEFIQSRMGMVSDSVECLQSLARPTSTCVRDLEAEHQMERDRDDDETLDELACELASTVDCEGRLTRCEGDFDAEEAKQNTAPVADEGKEEMSAAMEHVMDMSEVISEFELYQQRLMEEEDSDGE